MAKIPRTEHAQALAEEDPAALKSSQFKGIRKRKWGSWVSEIRMPRSREKLWLGSYTTAEQAARAYDAAVCCLRGPNATFNFPNSVPSIPFASSLSRHQIKLAAARYATLDQLPSISASAHNNNNNENGNANNDNDNNKARDDSASPSQSALVQETMSLMNGQHHQQEDELALWESLFAGPDDCPAKNSESLPSTDEASALKLIPFPSPSWAEQRHEQPEADEEGDMNSFLDVTDLWNFGDV